MGVEAPFNIGHNEVIRKVVDVLMSSGINDCGEQPACVGCAALWPKTMVCSSVYV